MRKAVFVFLLALLPFQFVWGAAAAYCQHEQSAASRHFGHHSHRHAASSKSDATCAAPDDNGKQAGTFADDPDCGACHLSCERPIASVQVMPAAAAAKSSCTVAPAAVAASPPTRIERPRWTLAA